MASDSSRVHESLFCFGGDSYPFVRFNETEEENFFSVEVKDW